MTEQREAATVAAMHTGDYTGIVLPDPPAALYQRIGELEKLLEKQAQWRADMPTTELLTMFECAAPVLESAGMFASVARVRQWLKGDS